MDRSRDVGLVREKEEEAEEKRIYLRTREEYPDQEYRGRDIPPTVPLLLLLLLLLVVQIVVHDAVELAAGLVSCLAGVVDVVGGSLGGG